VTARGGSGIAASCPRLSPDDVAFVAAHAVATPLRTSPELDARTGRTILVKDETVQRGASFKYRGALLGLRHAPAGVVAAGAGNLPIAVGLAAAALGKRACLIMPEDAPAAKRARARESGAELHLVPRSELGAVAAAEAERRGWRNLHAFESAEMILGSATLGLEIADAVAREAVPLDAVVVACGGGGLASGIALGFRSRNLAMRLYVIEPATHRRLACAREAGGPVGIEPSGTTICDALRPRRIGALAYEILEDSDVRIGAVDDDMVRRSVAVLRDSCGITAEPSGALAMGAVIGGLIGESDRRLCVIACGGNAD
jgi:threonine dehydratase